MSFDCSGSSWAGLSGTVPPASLRPLSKQLFDKQGGSKLHQIAVQRRFLRHQHRWQVVGAAEIEISQIAERVVMAAELRICGFAEK